MRYILHLRLDGFYVRRLPDHDPGTPTAISREKRVLDVNAPARALGVGPGMAVREAKVLLYGGTVVEWVESQFAHAHEEWLDAAAAYTGSLEPETQHTAYLDLSDHPDPLLIALQAVDALRPFADGVRWGFAQTKWLARLASEDDARAMPLQDLPAYLWKLSPYRLPISPEAKDRLHMLGYATVGDLTALAPEDLRDQFGSEGGRIYQVAWGGAHEAVRAEHPKNAISERLYFAGALEDLEQLDRHCRDLGERLGQRLCAGELQGQDVHLALDTEDGVRTLKRRFAKPIACPRSAYSALHLMLRDWKEPISGLRVTLPHLSQMRRVQQALVGVREAGTSDAEAALRHIRQVYGDRVIQKGSEVEVGRRTRLLKVWKDATGWR